MIPAEQLTQARERAAEMIRQSGVCVRPEQLADIQVVDFGMGELEQTGLQMLVVANTPVLTVKLLMLLPGQTCPQHRHGPFGDSPGKEETFRCVWGELYVMMPGEPTANPHASPPAHRREHFSSWNETVLQPGEQFTSPPDTPHWFQAGPQGAVLWTYETKSTDQADQFDDPDVAEKCGKLVESD